MKRTTLQVVAAALLAAGLFARADAAALTYHGILQDAGKPAQGNYDIELTLYSAASGGSVVGGPLTIYAVPVRDGSFNTQADFGPLAKAYSHSYVAVRVRAAGASDFTSLDGRSDAVPNVNSACPGSWSLDGNSGNPSGSYLGTADSSDVVVQAGGQVAGRFVSGTKSFAAATDFNNDGFESVALSDGGVSSTASFAVGGGKNGQASFSGSFVWGDSSTSGVAQDTAVNQFIVQATGGVGINTAHGPLGTDTLGGTELTIRPTLGLGHQAWINLLSQRTATSVFRGINLVSDPINGDSVDDGAFALRGIFRKSDGTVLYEPMLSAQTFDTVSSTSGNTHFQLNGAPLSLLSTIVVGTTSSNGNGASLTIGGVWTNASSRTFKDGFSGVDARGVLDKVVSMPVQTWFYKGDHDEGRHMGPVAEDFAQAFGLGNDEKHIGTVDENGVAFAAIQGLNEKVEDENSTLKRQNAALQGKLDEVLARLSKLEAKGN